MRGRAPLLSSSAVTVDLVEPLAPLRVFEVSVDRWDDVGGHASFRAVVSVRELPPDLSRESLNFAADADAHKGLARILLPATLPGKYQQGSPTSAASSSPAKRGSAPAVSPPPAKGPWRAERGAAFDEFRQMRRQLYSILRGEPQPSKAFSVARSVAGSSSDSRSDTGTAFSDAGSTWDDAPREGEHGLPPFPRTLFRRSLGLPLSSSQMRERAAGLDAWLRAVVFALPSWPPPAVALVANWLGLDGAKAEELALAESAAKIGVDCNPIPLPEPAPAAAARTWGFRSQSRPSNVSVPIPAPSPPCAVPESPEHTAARVKITRLADSMLSEGAIDRKEHALMLLPFAAPPPVPMPAAITSHSLPLPAVASHTLTPPAATSHFSPPPAVASQSLPQPAVNSKPPSIQLAASVDAACHPSLDCDDDDSDTQDPALAFTPEMLRLQAIVDREGREESGEGKNDASNVSLPSAAGGGSGCCIVS